MTLQLAAGSFIESHIGTWKFANPVNCSVIYNYM